jgi:hypothetical protein
MMQPLKLNTMLQYETTKYNLALKYIAEYESKLSFEKMECAKTYSINDTIDLRILLPIRAINGLFAYLYSKQIDIDRNDMCRFPAKLIKDIDIDAISTYNNIGKHTIMCIKNLMNRIA